ncbi:MAG: chemotaxis protein CheW, partial [bacterium]
MAEQEKIDTDLLKQEHEDTLAGKYLTFQVDEEEYGIEIRHITEIIGIQNITELPDVPNFIKGVINLRGKVIPVVDVRLRLGIEEHDYNERTSIIVVNINNMTVGLIVDTVSEVLDIPESELEPPVKLNKGVASRFIQAFGKVGEEVKILLNTKKLLFDEEFEQITEQVCSYRGCFKTEN